MEDAVRGDSMWNLRHNLAENLQCEQVFPASGVRPRADSVIYDGCSHSCLARSIVIQITAELRQVASYTLIQKECVQTEHMQWLP